MRLYHGSQRHEDGLTLHEGICLATDEETSEDYAGRSGRVFELHLDADDLMIGRCDDYRYEDDVTPADDPEYRAEWRARGYDALLYQDVDWSGRVHDCIRLISDRALAAAAVLN